jgi:hypothetical protein|tara:strand:+ start:313 stop:690 length:378 start_codon:yes stop_codon:yes gene_type:complete
VATTVLDNQYFTSKFVYETDLQKEPLQNITNGAATVRSITILNGSNSSNSEVLYLKMYDTADTVDATTTEADYVFQVDVQTDTTFTFGSAGLPVVNGLTIRLVTGIALNANTDPSSSIIAEITYN